MNGIIGTIRFILIYIRFLVVGDIGIRGIIRNPGRIRHISQVVTGNDIIHTAKGQQQISQREGQDDITRQVESLVENVDQYAKHDHSNRCQQP